MFLFTICINYKFGWVESEVSGIHWPFAPDKYVKLLPVLHHVHWVSFISTKQPFAGQVEEHILNS